MSHHASPRPDQTEPGATRDVIPYRVHLPEADIEDLRQRLTRARFPHRETVPGILKTDLEPRSPG